MKREGEPVKGNRGTMPGRLVLVRHGESEANLLHRAIKHGELRDYPEGFANVPDREFRLSPQGREQATATGGWLAGEYPKGVDVIFVSDHVRARETAGLICQSAGWSEVEILVDPLLGERSWGRFAEQEPETQRRIMGERKRDPLHAAMPHGESLLITRLRTRVLLERVAREFSGGRVLVFSHGEYIEAVWAEIEHMDTVRQREFFHSEQGDIRNCQVVEFSSLEPSTGNTDGKLRWVRSSCPQAEVFTEWRQIHRRKFSPDDLLAYVEQYPHLRQTVSGRGL